MTLERATSPMTYAASSVVVFSSLTINEWVAIGGLCIGIATFGMNWWFQWQRLRLEKQNLEKKKPNE